MAHLTIAQRITNHNIAGTFAKHEAMYPSDFQKVQAAHLADRYQIHYIRVLEIMAGRVPNEPSRYFPPFQPDMRRFGAIETPLTPIADMNALANILEDASYHFHSVSSFPPLSLFEKLGKQPYGLTSVWLRIDEAIERNPDAWVTFADGLDQLRSEVINLVLFR